MEDVLITSEMERVIIYVCAKKQWKNNKVFHKKYIFLFSFFHFEDAGLITSYNIAI